MSFYITLPSNASMDLFPNNTLTHFKTKLSSTLQLDGDYEVALTEIMFPFNWKFREKGSIVFTHNSHGGSKEVVRREIVFDRSLFVYDTLHSLIDGLNMFTKQNKVEVEFFYDAISHKVFYEMGKQWSMEFLNRFNLDFGIKYDFIQGSPEKASKHEGEYRIANTINSIKSLYVYTDIVEHQYTGDTFAPLLRVVGVDNDRKFGDYVERIYNTPHYIPVLKKSIDTIEIDIRSDLGDSIEFGIGKLVAKLHFRPKPFF